MSGKEPAGAARVNRMRHNEMTYMLIMLMICCGERKYETL
jgi:hypothetical protein